MRRNLERLGGLVHSQRVLIALTRAGLSREEAYGLVQRHAMTVWGKGGDFQALLAADPEVARRLPPKVLAAQFDLTYHLKAVDRLFARVFGAGPRARRRAAVAAGKARRTKAARKRPS
jgi:adenylosuccinate lyase